jgi:ribonuclease Z
MRFRCLGMAGHSFGEHGTASLLLLGSTAAPVLIDCGPSTPQELQRHGCALGTINAVVLTHRHLDHVLGFPYLLVGRKLAQSAPSGPLTVICDRSTQTALHTLVEFAQPDLLPLDIEWMDIETLVDRPVPVEGLEIRTTPVEHTVPTYGVVARSPGGPALAYSSDTRPCETFSAAAAGASVIVHEAFVDVSSAEFARARGHSTAAEAGEVLQHHPHARGFLIHCRESHLDRLAVLEAEASTAAGRTVRYLRKGEVLDL